MQDKHAWSWLTVWSLFWFVAVSLSLVSVTLDCALNWFFKDDNLFSHTNTKEMTRQFPTRSPSITWNSKWNQQTSENCFQIVNDSTLRMVQLCHLNKGQKAQKQKKAFWIDDITKNLHNDCDFEWSFKVHNGNALCMWSWKRVFTMFSIDVTFLRLTTACVSLKNRTNSVHAWVEVTLHKSNHKRSGDDAHKKVFWNCMQWFSKQDKMCTMFACWHVFHVQEWNAHTCDILANHSKWQKVEHHSDTVFYLEKLWAESVMSVHVSCFVIFVTANTTMISALCIHFCMMMHQTIVFQHFSLSAECLKFFDFWVMLEQVMQNWDYLLFHCCVVGCCAFLKQHMQLLMGFRSHTEFHEEWKLYMCV